jgi:hypothetical protein
LLYTIFKANRKPSGFFWVLNYLYELIILCDFKNSVTGEEDTFGREQVKAAGGTTVQIYV